MTEYQGLIECPMQQSYIEFTYHEGDRISDLRTKVASQWGMAAKRANIARIADSRALIRRRTNAAWVFLCQDETGAYLRLRDDEPIPTTNVKEDKAVKMLIDDRHEFFNRSGSFQYFTCLH